MARDRTNVEWKGDLNEGDVRLEAIESRLRLAAAGEAAPEDPLSRSPQVHFGEELHQRDVYFRCRASRLKLRQIRGGPNELIWYRRSNESGVRACHYRRLEIADPQRVEAGLAATLGVEVEVVKDRRLYWWRNVRIHLDRVQGLGEFIEFEAVLFDRSQLSVGEQQLATLLQWLGLSQGVAIATSYRDLVLSRREVNHCRERSQAIRAGHRL